MEFVKEMDCIKQSKENLILKLYEELGHHSAHDFAFEELEDSASLFFDFITNLDIPLENHTFVEELYDVLLLNKCKLPFFIVYFDCWRKIFIDLLMESNPKNDYAIISKIITRINFINHKIIEVKLERNFTIIKEKDEKINKLHNDRIHLIGKMASSMAHEIRNPLTSIAGFLNLIRANILNKADQQLLRYINVIEDEFEAINMHITGFLSFSKDRVSEEKNTEISLSELINVTLFLLIPRLTNENIHFVVREEKNCYINIQKVSIQQVISNIISNAIDALISVNYDRKLEIWFDETEEFIQIMISNNGPQIPVEFRDSLFVPFMTSKETGTGLGLAISREIMDKNNGIIDFESNEHETCFKLSFRKDVVGGSNKLSSPLFGPVNSLERSG
jgi:two-component system, sporulation sensor kinase D